MKALGLVSLDRTVDVEKSRRVIRRTAELHGLEVVDVMTYRRDDPKWVFRMLECVHCFGAHAVIVPGSSHLHGLDRAVTGAADLVMQGVLRPYVGYGIGHTRASATGRVGVA